ncbi:MAG: hypothetical protein D6806_00730 [Deltaproteobacteria bacterium]|nr:MAG: hypothetical protein D6806_00730 [Deltaproteobacteria bacterium]
MNFGRLVAIPLVGGFAVALVGIAGAGSEWWPVFKRVEIEAAKIAALSGCLLAAYSYSKGDYLRRSWLLMAASTALLLVRDATIIMGFDPKSKFGLVQGSIVVIGNVFAVVAIYMFGRTSKLTGLDNPWSPAKKWALTINLVLLALVLTGPSIVLGIEDLLAGDNYALTGIGSSLGDLFAFILLAPLLLLTVALSGGVLANTWKLLSLALVGWMGYDLVTEVLPRLYVSDVTVSVLREVLRTMACLFELSAGLCQRAIVRSAGAERK